jgi:two-component system, OmpR family, alkaline phosphatase synthesis response regulator PhoP
VAYLSRSPSSPRVLVVEDDRRVAEGVVHNLALEGFDVASVGSAEEAAATLTADSGIDLVVLDIILPGMDGLELCRRLREAGNTVPILFLTARGSDGDRLLGLRLGADDYLTKPFLVEELVLRIRGILRRSDWSRSPPMTGPTLRIGGRTVDLSDMRAETTEGDVQLTERETMLLRYFAENEGRVVTRRELLERVWGYSFDTSTRTLDTFVHRLRKYFEDEPQHPRYFHTVRGVGYRFTSGADE